MNKKKICVLHAQVPFIRGGAEIMVENLTNELIKRNFDAELIQIPFKWYPENTLYDNMMLWRMLDLEEANGQKIDLVVATKFPSYGVKHPNKVVWLMHQYRQVYDLYSTGTGLEQTPRGAFVKSNVTNFDTKVINEAQSVYSISQNVSNRLKHYNGIDSQPLYQPPALTGRYYSDTYGSYVVSVGRLDLLKRNNLLIQSLAYCNKSIDIKIAGKGPEMENLMQLAEKLGVSDRVEFLGFISDEDLLSLYANAFAVFFAPVDEDYGFITLEAFLSKKPVITCEDSGGVLEFVSHNENGLICSHNPKDIAEKINRLYENKENSKRLGLNGYDRVKNITWDNVIDKLTRTL